MRFLRFSLVGLAGIVVQLTVLAALVHGAGMHYLAAAVAALVGALAHNYLWHARWTWRDRRPAGGRHTIAFVRFATSNGLVSLLGAVGLMPLLVDGTGLPPVLANLVVVAVSGLVNFRLAGRWCFGGGERRLAPTRGAIGSPAR